MGGVGILLLRGRGSSVLIGDDLALLLLLLVLLLLLRVGILLVGVRILTLVVLIPALSVGSLLVASGGLLIPTAGVVSLRLLQLVLLRGDIRLMLPLLLIVRSTPTLLLLILGRLAPSFCRRGLSSRVGEIRVGDGVVTESRVVRRFYVVGGLLRSVAVGVGIRLAGRGRVVAVGIALLLSSVLMLLRVVVVGLLMIVALLICSVLLLALLRRSGLSEPVAGRVVTKQRLAPLLTACTVMASSSTKLW